MREDQMPERTWPPLKGRFRWLTVAIKEVINWPAFEYFQDYDGFEFILLPETTRSPPAVAIELRPPLDYRSARAAIRRFLSAYSWAENHAAIDDFGVGGVYPGGAGKMEGPVLISEPGFRLDYLPSTIDAKIRLCLALYREALGLNNDSYRFLAFFKIVNVLHGGWSAQVAWINDAIPKLTEEVAIKRLAELRKTEGDLGHYLYVSGRCAVAHAFAQPVADPDEPTDTDRLRADLPILQALAEHLVEYELEVKSTATIVREHLYELEGFRLYFGADLTERLRAKKAVELEDIPELPLLSFHVREHLPQVTFLRMRVRVTDVQQGVVKVECVANSSHATIIMEMDFPEERLRINPLEGIKIFDDGTSNATHAAMDAHKYGRHIFENRVVEVWTEGSDRPWGRTAPYIPINMRFNRDAWRHEQLEIFKVYLLRIGSELLADSKRIAD